MKGARFTCSRRWFLKDGSLSTDQATEFLEGESVRLADNYGDGKEGGPRDMGMDRPLSQIWEQLSLAF